MQYRAVLAPCQSIGHTSSLPLARLALIPMLTLLTFAQLGTAFSQNVFNISVPAEVAWYDTGIAVSAGNKITIQASGRISASNERQNISPAGITGASASELGKRLAFLAPGLTPWSLMAKSAFQEHLSKLAQKPLSQRRCPVAFI